MDIQGMGEIGGNESPQSSEYSETLTDYQDAPCPRLLADWCENEMRLEYTKAEE